MGAVAGRSGAYLRASPSRQLAGEGVPAMIGRSNHRAAAAVRLLSRVRPALLPKGRRPGLRPVRRLLPLLAASLSGWPGLARRWRLVGVCGLQNAPWTLWGVGWGVQVYPALAKAGGADGSRAGASPGTQRGRTGGGPTSRRFTLPKVDLQTPPLRCFYGCWPVSSSVKTSIKLQALDT